MNAPALRTITAIRPFVAPALLAAGGGTATVLGSIEMKRESAKIAAESRAGRTPDLGPMYKTFGLTGVGIATAGAGLVLATHAAKTGLPSLLHTVGFAGTAVGAGVALVGLLAMGMARMEHGSHAAPQAPGARGFDLYGAATPALL